jgi:hypothetical protein
MTMDRVSTREINLQDFFGRMEATQKNQWSQEQHVFDTPGLKDFLVRAIEFLAKPDNVDKAEAVAHFLMGIEHELPEGLSHEGLQLGSKQKSALHDLLRTHRYSFFGTEEDSSKTISKLDVLKKNIIDHQSASPVKENSAGDNDRKMGLAPGGFLVNINYVPMVQAPPATNAIVGVTPKPEESLEKILDTAPPSFKSHPNFSEFQETARNYLNYMAPLQGQNFAEILAKPGLTLLDLIGSIKAYSHKDLDPGTVREKCLERDLVNMQMRRNWVETQWVRDGRADDTAGLNFTQDVLGVEHSYVEREDADLSPGSQVSLAMDTEMRREDGTLKRIKTLTVTMPALDSAAQPEFKIYTDGKPGIGMANLNSQQFSDATATIKQQILDWVKDNQPCKRVVLSAIGAGEFLKMLNGASKEQAREIIATALAEVTEQLASENIVVGFSDLNESFCQQIAGKLPEGVSIQFLGALPRNPGFTGPTKDWIEEGDLLLIPGDAASLAGNGLSIDTSFEGYTGRNSLMSIQHTLAITAARLGLG